jgi:hypothetical protein
MKTTYFRRNLVLGVMFLFIGAFVVPNLGGSIACAMDREDEWMQHTVGTAEVVSSVLCKFFGVSPSLSI